MFEQFFQFIKHHYFLAVYCITWLVSVKYYKKYFDTALRFFPIIIAYTFFTELLGFLIGTSEKYVFFSKLESSNDIIYNIYGLVFFSYFHFVLWKLTNKKTYKKVISTLWIISLSSFIVNSFFQNPLTRILFHATSLAALMLVIAVLIYWLDKKSEWSWKIYKYNLMTYISGGLFIFYSVFPFIFLANFLKYDFWVKYNLGTIHKSLIVIMYSLFCFGFYISHRKTFR